MGILRWPIEKGRLWINPFFLKLSAPFILANKDERKLGVTYGAIDSA